MYTEVLVNTKMLPKKVVISPQDSVTVPQLGGTAHEGAIYTGPEGTPGKMSVEQQIAQTPVASGAKEVTWGSSPNRCILIPGEGTAELKLPSKHMT